MSATDLSIDTYDALSRRITEGGGTGTHLYYSKDWQVIEERNSSGTTKTQYVWSGVSPNLLVLRDRDTDADGVMDERLFVIQDRRGVEHRRGRRG